MKLTDEEIDAIWNSIDGTKVISGTDCGEWNRQIRRAFALALLAAHPAADAAGAPSNRKAMPPKLTKEMRAAMVRAAREYAESSGGGNSPDAMYEAAFDAAPTPTVAADAVAPNSTVALTAGQIEAAADKFFGAYTDSGYSRVTLPNLINFVASLAMFTVSEAAQPDERAAFDVWFGRNYPLSAEAIRTGLCDDEIQESHDELRCGFTAGWQARAASQATVKGEKFSMTDDALKRFGRSQYRDGYAQAAHEFKNFHRLLCERFDYVHDEQDWQRDQLSLIEWIAACADSRAAVSQASTSDDERTD